MSAGDDDELFRRPGTPPSPPGPPPAMTRRPRYPGSVAPAPAAAPPPRAAPPRTRTEVALEGGADTDPGDDDEPRGPLPLPVVVGGLAAVVVAVLAGVFMLRPALGVGTDEPTAAPRPTATSSPAASGPTRSADPTSSGTATVPALPSVLVDPPSTPPSTSSGSSTAGDGSVVTELQAIRDRDLGRVRFEGQWVAQLAAKYFGIVDPLQTTASGSHTFMPPDVLAEYRQLRQRFGDPVVLLLGTDHSPRVTAPSGARLWVTSYTGRFRSAEEVQDWCRRAYPTLTGRALANQCVPRRFTP